MHRFFSSQFFNFELTRILGTAPYGGCQVAEFLEAVGKIKKHDAESWYRAWAEQGEKTERFAAEAAEKGLDAYARDAYLRASNYFRAAPYMLTAPDDRIVDMSERSGRNFQHATSFFEGRVIDLKIPYEKGLVLPGRLFLPSKAKQLPKQKTPVIVNCGGADSTQEELYFMYGAKGVELGYAVLLFDGPGQGATLKRHGAYLRPDFEVVVSSVLDHVWALAGQSPELQLDLNRVAVAGASLGAHFALRAATDRRIAACVAIDPFYSMWDLALTRMPQWFALSWLNGYIPDSFVNWSCYAHMRTDFPSWWEFSLTMWIMNQPTPADLLREFTRYTLRDANHGELLDLVNCPVLVAGAKDSIYTDPEVSTLRIAKLLKKVPEEQKDVWLPQSAGEGSLTAKVGAWDHLAVKTFSFLDKQFGIDRAGDSSSSTFSSSSAF
ncbi:uncharacterized protein K452DRAFT_234204 [Aplosporella prunicola CBS 121167]|uniref:AB hydrolase-1 domain-containing protein n=1 Tax=Aplosporella prunicola CBS 121167 TaxID=1176127 RepID=A0A6A6B340_9PEZI|nr:uncharacterized protein K452DRAFT_234204 [Aplosporella prunicola CBS 121167]KAF2138632.1 hypothetical protein K452DRAFT_234204 [Aplosporella prunicola CBS 121167]